MRLLIETNFALRSDSLSSSSSKSTNWPHASSSLMQAWGGNEWFVGFCSDAPSCRALYWTWAVLGGCDLLDMVCEVCLSFRRILLDRQRVRQQKWDEGCSGQEEWKWLGHGILPTWLFLGKRSFSVMATSWWDDNSHKCEDVFWRSRDCFPMFLIVRANRPLSAPTLSIRSLRREHISREAHNRCSPSHGRGRSAVHAGSDAAPVRMLNPKSPWREDASWSTAMVLQASTGRWDAAARRYPGNSCKQASCRNSNGIQRAAALHGHKQQLLLLHRGKQNISQQLPTNLLLSNTKKVTPLLVLLTT